MFDQFKSKMVHELVPGDLVDGEGNQYLECNYDTYAFESVVDQMVYMEAQIMRMLKG